MPGTLIAWDGRWPAHRESLQHTTPGTKAKSLAERNFSKNHTKVQLGRSQYPPQLLRCAGKRTFSRLRLVAGADRAGGFNGECQSWISMQGRNPAYRGYCMGSLTRETCNNNVA